MYNKNVVLCMIISTKMTDTHYVSRLHTVIVTVPRFQIPRSSVLLELKRINATDLFTRW